MNCKYCNSENLVLKQESFETDDILKANRVSLRCADCGKFIKWCSKADRKTFIINSIKDDTTQPTPDVKEKQIDISKKDVLTIIDHTLICSSKLLASSTIRSAEVRALINGIRKEVAEL